MSKLNAIRSVGTDHLSVSHKAMLTTHTGLDKQLDDAVLQTDLDFNITGWNSAAEELHGQPGAMGKNLFTLVDIGFVNANIGEMRKALSAKSYWSGEVLFKRYDGQQIYFRTTATYIIDEKGDPVAIMIVSHNINDIKNKEKQLEAATKKYEILIPLLQKL